MCDNKFFFVGIKICNPIFNYLSDTSSGQSSAPPELIMTEADAVDPESEDEPERKDSLDVHDEGKE